MTGNNSSSDFRPSRRQFIAGATGLTFGFVLDPFTVGSKALAASAELSPNFWITIGADNIIKIVSPVAEMGQGTFTTMPLIVAEELDADWSKVSIVQPPVWDAKKYGNPEYTGLLITSASYSVKGYFKTIRIAGAQARRVLVEAAATHWKVAAGRNRASASAPSFTIVIGIGMSPPATCGRNPASWSTRRAVGGSAMARSQPSRRCRRSCRRSASRI